MTIGINLEVNGKNIVVTMDEARMIHNELASIFNMNTQVANVHGIQKNEVNAAHKAKNVTNKARTTIDSVKGESVPVDNVSTPSEQVSDKYENPRVEAAKKRAAKRTSGCGARRN